MLLYSGHGKEDIPHTQGVALMLSEEARNALVEQESQESRIIRTSFKTKKEGITVNVVQCYASTNDSKDDNKDQFNEKLQSIVGKCLENNLTILMGNLNAKVSGWTTSDMKISWDDMDWESEAKMVRDLKTYVHSTNWL
ncbi:unnamed protein product [Schistosoma margrebowiei]|uniref:Uncharacterized protein n=1 Tax=Schistosoma margrebowiei TaxID=48269 RepID=A0A183M3B0_9TREM|nr:unnamed protein product [Schistosoma margrebowiei]